MSNRRSIGVQQAVDLVRAGSSLRSAARAIGCSLSAVRSALRRDGEPPRPQAGYPKSMWPAEISPAQTGPDGGDFPEPA
jgi:hypothetical protein